MKKAQIVLLSLSLSCLLVGCGGNGNASSSSSFSSSSSETAKEKATIEVSSSASSIYLEPNDVTITETFHTIEDKRYYNTRVLPSVGDVKLLVIPVLVPGYDEIDIDGDEVDDKDTVHSDIEDAFFGKDGQDNIGYESVSSFYEKSSYGKLHLSGEVTPWFSIEDDSDLGYTSAAEIDVSETYGVVNAAIEWAKETENIDMTNYDYDEDGYIDGVWLVYSCKNYSNGGPSTDYKNYWAYTTWANQTTKGNVKSPIANLFGWASYDFMYEGYGKTSLDAHTYIHETGHFLGLSDYYSDSSRYNPVGKVDMMDGNIIDHNSYSKMLLGWTKPYIIRDNKSVDLLSMENENACIVIPSDSTSITNGEFDPFGEYMLVEFYTNDGLNHKDSRVALTDRPLAMNKHGVRIYHVDSRKFLVDASDKTAFTYKVYEGEEITSTDRLILPISNGRSTDTYNNVFHIDSSINQFDELRMIEPKKVNTFSDGGYQKDNTLFVEGNEFSMKDYASEFFVNESTFDSKEAFSSSIKIGAIL